MGSIGEVFREVEATTAHYGVVPVENSTEGGVGSTLDMFVRSPLHVCGEVELRVHHHLLARADAMNAITRVYAHQQALAQCRAWLDARLPRAERRVASSNAEAARLVAGASGAAAIASETAAELYGLNVLAANIEDEPDNTTRFAVIGVQGSGPSTGRDKTSILFTVHNRPGALYELLAPLAAHHISMTRVESRPSRRGNWDYVFFVDIEGHRDDLPVTAALAEVEARASLLKILGSYPRARL
jgi:chorismate mutase/prephenate dehydratase